MGPISGYRASAPVGGPEAPRVENLSQAASEFEALLVGKLLEAAFSSDEGADGLSGGMMDFGREQLARTICSGGGLGLAKVLESALQRSDGVKR